MKKEEETTAVAAPTKTKAKVMAWVGPNRKNPEGKKWMFKTDDDHELKDSNRIVLKNCKLGHSPSDFLNLGCATAAKGQKVALVPSGLVIKELSFRGTGFYSEGKYYENFDYLVFHADGKVTGVPKV